MPLRLSAVALLLLAAPVSFSACGMNRAVTVLPNTADALQAQSAGFRGETPPKRRPEGRIKP